MRALHLVARAALRLVSSRDAKRVVVDAARVLPRFSVDDARAAADALDGRGTCLSRAIAIAARLPRSEVIIGVGPGEDRSPLRAHAWVEIDGAPLRPTDPRGEEIARI